MASPRVFTIPASAPFVPTSLAPETRTYVVRADPARFSDLSAKLAADPRVELIEPDAHVALAFSDVDPARWPDPEELLASLANLRNAYALSKR